MGFGGWLSGACVGTPTFSAFPRAMTFKTSLVAVWYF
jgi:hypothetical protein